MLRLAFGVFTLGTGGGKVMGTDGNLRLLQKIQPDVLIGMPTFLYHVLHMPSNKAFAARPERLVLAAEKAPKASAENCAIRAKARVA